MKTTIIALTVILTAAFSLNAMAQTKGEICAPVIAKRGDADANGKPVPSELNDTLKKMCFLGIDAARNHPNLYKAFLEISAQRHDEAVNDLEKSVVEAGDDAFLTGYRAAGGKE